MGGANSVSSCQPSPAGEDSMPTPPLISFLPVQPGTFGGIFNHDSEARKQMDEEAR